MVKVNAIATGPVPAGKDGQIVQAKAAQASFGSAAIGMSWQLAVVVLLPILGGYKLDQHTHALPLWTLTGLVVGLVGSILVIKRALAAFGNFSVAPGGVATTDATTSETEKGQKL